MSSFWDQIRQGAGNAIEAASMLIAPGARDTGFSEWVAGGPTNESRTQAFYTGEPTSAGYQPESRDPSILGGTTGSLNQITQNTPPPAPTGDTSGGGGGGGDTRLEMLRKMGYLNPSQLEEMRLLEGAPQEPQIDYDAMFAPAFEALNQQDIASQSAFETGVSEAEGSSATQKAGLQSEQASRLARFGEQRGEAQQQTEGAVSAARRQAAELMQGIQARYGGTTGTGRFVSEQLGSQATRNIAGFQQSLQNTMAKIGQAENELRTKVTDLTAQADQWLQTQKLNLRSELDRAIAAVGAERGRLETEKGRERIETLQQYQQTLADVNARNTQFMQQLYQGATAAANELDQLRAKAQEKYSVDTKSYIDVGGINDLVESGVIQSGQAGNIPFDKRGSTINDLLKEEGRVGQISGTVGQTNTGLRIDEKGNIITGS